MGELSFGLQDKVVLITGGSRGIGLELARQFLAQGAKVAVCGRKQESLEAALAELGPGPVLAQACHVAKEDQVEALFAKVESTHGRLDILVNNVGMNLPSASLADTELGLWHKIMDSNLTGGFLCSRAAARLMRRQKAGKIITVTSTAARRAAPAMGIYGIAKASLEMMTKVLASELAQFNVQVNAVAPGMVKTDFSKPFWGNPAMLDRIVAGIPLGRLAETGDVVRPVLFLASPAADYVTGHTILVDGGAMAV